MQKHKQLFKHNPELGTWGDCHRTVIACLLNLHPSAVPNWSEKYWEDTNAWNAAMRAYLNEHGYSCVQIPYIGNLDDILTTFGNCNPGIYYILTGMSRNGTNHCVIGMDNKIVWDPALDDSGIVGPCKNTPYYWIDVLVPNLVVQSYADSL